jgi:hypothetical protein
MKRHDLACLRVHGDPDPLPVGLLLHYTPHLIGLSLQPSQHHIGWTGRQLAVSVLGTGRKALNHDVQEPCETKAHRTADPAQGNALAQQMLNQRTPLVGNETLFGAGHKLASAGFALMILLTTMYVAVFLELY